MIAILSVIIVILLPLALLSSINRNLKRSNQEMEQKYEARRQEHRAWREASREKIKALKAAQAVQVAKNKAAAPNIDTSKWSKRDRDAFEAGRAAALATARSKFDLRDYREGD